MIAQPTSRTTRRNSAMSGCRDVAGDRLELVERAAGVAEAAPGNHRHEGAAGRQHRREHQADIVADAAGRMLVDHGPGRREIAPVEHDARVHHARASDATRSSMSMPRKNTAIAKAAACPSVTAPEVRPAMKASISRGVRLAPVALGADDFLRQHQAASSCAWMKARSSCGNVREALAATLLRFLVAGIAARQARREIGHQRDRRRSAGRDSAPGSPRARSTCRRDRRREFSPRGFPPASRSSGRRTTCRRLRATRGRRRRAAARSVVEQRGIVGLGQRHEAMSVGEADQRIDAGEVDVVGDGDERRRAPVDVAGRRRRW